MHTSGQPVEGTEWLSDARESLPVAGAPGWLGVVFNVYSQPFEGLKRRYAVGGHSYVAVVEFSDPVRAKSLLVFGQSADPASPHHLDQAPLYAAGEMKPAWFSKADIEANTTRVYQPGTADE